MASLFDRYNLNPFERRLVVFVGLAVFIVLNMVLVWPKFGEWKKITEGMDTAEQQKMNYERMIARTPTFEARLEELKGQGSDVLPSARANELAKIIQTEALKSQLPVPNIIPQTTRASADELADFFDRKAFSLVVDTDDEPLIRFLVAIGTNSAMIRVRDLDLSPKRPAETNLTCKMTLVASYQKQPSSE